MRNKGYTIRSSLSIEAASLVKQALSLARRRGHAQVTPLHVASAMLASSTSLFRKACLQAHSHPLQSKALELCFNVALNRLNTSTSGPIFPPHPHIPRLSNALVAAFKRAQAHHRRGSTENNQQHQDIQALKVEIVQLVISILDDPSVSRVMREAGFSSTQVKNNVEKSHKVPTGEFKFSLKKKGNEVKNDDDDVMSVIDAMMNKKKKNNVILGEYIETADRVVRGVIDVFNKGEVKEDMKNVQFISVLLHTLRNINRGGFEEKLGELRLMVRDHMNGGVVLYLGDLQWVCEFWSRNDEMRNDHYSPVENMIMEISRLSDMGENGKLWIMGTATYKTYSKCKTGHPSLQTLWNLHPLPVPVCGLGLSLNLESDLGRNFNNEAHTTNTCSSMPSWLQKYKEEHTNQTSNVQECNKLKDLCIKWNCSSVHEHSQFLEKPIKVSSPSPSSSNSLSSDDQKSSKFHKTFLCNKKSIKQHQFFICGEIPEFLSIPNSSPNSASSSEESGNMNCLNRFNEVNSYNQQILCNALQKKVPWQSDIIPDIVRTVLQCRAGKMMSKNRVINKQKRQETWLVFLGIDLEGKYKISKELARLVFGSQDSYVSISLSSFSDDSNDEMSNKRSTDEHGRSYLGRFADAVRENPSRVFFMEDLDQVDYHSQKGIKKAIEDGCFMLRNGEIVPLVDAIVIFSCESFSNGRKDDGEEERNGDNLKGMKPCISLDLNISIETSVSEMGVLDLVDNHIIFTIQDA